MIQKVLHIVSQLNTVHSSPTAGSDKKYDSACSVSQLFLTIVNRFGKLERKLTHH